MSVARAATAAASSIAAHAAAGAAARATASVLPPKLASGVAPKFAVHMSQRHSGVCLVTTARVTVTATEIAVPGGATASAAADVTTWRVP